MSRLSRATQLIFGTSGSVGEFGSAAAGTPTTTTSVALAQSLSQWASGWLAAVLGSSKFPAIEDMNAVAFVTTAQLAYLFQQGIPEYDAGTTYYIGSICVNPNTYQMYGSKTNANVGNALTSGSNWQFLGDLAALINKTETITGSSRTYTAADGGYMALRSNSGTLMTDILPGTSPGVMAQGWEIEIVNNDSSALMLINVGSGANLDGSSSGALAIGGGQRVIVFSDGSNYWSKYKPSRLRLASAASIFLSASGSDSNTGFASGSPLLTISHALSVIANGWDIAGNSATLQLADGTYTTGTSFDLGVIGADLAGLVINGNAVTPSNVLISVSGTNALYFARAMQITLQNMKLQTSSGNWACIVADQGATVALGAGMQFGTCSGVHMSGLNGGRILANGNYTINGNALAHLAADYGAFISITGRTITLSGTPAFSSAFATAADCSTMNLSSNTFSGAATGARYLAQTNAVINTGGGGASYLPGNSAGSIATQGLYI